MPDETTLPVLPPGYASDPMLAHRKLEKRVTELEEEVAELKRQSPPLTSKAKTAAQGK